MRLTSRLLRDSNCLDGAHGYRTPLAAGSPCHLRKGVVLIAVLVVIVLLTLAAYQFSDSMIAELRAADSTMRSAQARALADSGVNYAMVLVSSPDSMADMLGGNPFDNPGMFFGIIIGSPDAVRPGRFTIVAPPETGGTFGNGAIRYGLVDEAGRINLSALLKIDSSGAVAREMLLKIPHLADQEEIVNAILDWLDPDDEPRPNGAEGEYYSALSPPYRPKNGPLDTIEELLLVRGVTPELLFGNDRNRNGVLDPDEDNGTDPLDRGLSEYLTVYSRERNVDLEGNARININDADLAGLQEKLVTAVGEDLATYIIAYRVYGASGGSSSGSTPTKSTTTPTTPTKSGSSSGGGSSGASSGGSGGGRLTRTQVNTQNARPRRISSLFDLVNSSVDVPATSPTGPRTTTYPSPLNDAAALRQYLPLLLDKVTTSRDAELPGRINVNTAPEVVLRTLAGLQESDIQNILTERPNPSAGQEIDPIYQTPAWLLTEANLSPQTLRTLERYITARTQVYRVQVIGHFDGGGPTARVEAVLDTNNGRPRLLYWRDLTELGRGIDLQSLGDRGSMTGR